MPFISHSKKVIYDNPWIKLTEHQVTIPNGKPGIYGVVHFKNRAIGVVPYENGKIWLVGQERFPLSQYSWEIPEGGCPYDEELEAAAHRELSEETGIKASRLDEIVRMHLSNSVSDELAVVYLARGLTHGQAHPEDTEELALREVSLAEAYAMVTRGEITDAIAVAAIFKLELMRLEGTLDSHAPKA